MPDHSNILGDLLGDGDELSPAPLQNTTKLSNTFEVIADVLNTSKNSIDDANTAINELQNITSAIEHDVLKDNNRKEAISDHVMYQNQSTATLQ